MELNLFLLRIIYKFDDDTVCILLIGKPNDDEVYKHTRKFP
jgi:mRNA-degrading endonuclease RelE of RelBE toxin-antitoxin system